MEKIKWSEKVTNQQVLECIFQESEVNLIIYYVRHMIYNEFLTFQ
jgi:hypothetical protein